MSDAEWWVTDLLLVVLLTGIAGAGVFLGVGGPVRVVLALALVLVLPGYAIVAAFFPASNRGADDLGRFDDEPGGLVNPLPNDYEIDGIERLALSVTLSIAVVPAVAAVSSFTPWGVRVEPILVGVTVLTVLFVVLAAVRRLQLPPSKRFHLPMRRLVAVPTPFETGSPLGRASRRRRTANLAAVAATVLVLSSVGFALAYPPAGETFTEFYVAGEGSTGGDVRDYPSSFTVGEPRTVTVAIENLEGSTVTYSVVAVLRDDGASTADSGATTLSTDRVTVEDGGTERLPIQVSPTRSGDDLLLQFLLFRGDPPTSATAEGAYLTLDLRVDVDRGGSFDDGSFESGSAGASAAPEGSAR